MVLLLAAAGESPKGDSFDVDYVAHEAGHQFNIEHTWSGKRGGCSKGQFATSFDASSQAAMELGAGTTMATYAGICGADDLQPNASPYFHVFSLHEFEVGIAASSLELASPARDPGEPSRHAPHPPPPFSGPLLPGSRNSSNRPPSPHAAPRRRSPQAAPLLSPARHAPSLARPRTP